MLFLRLESEFCLKFQTHPFQRGFSFIRDDRRMKLIRSLRLRICDGNGLEARPIRKDRLHLVLLFLSSLPVPFIGVPSKVSPNRQYK